MNTWNLEPISVVALLVTPSDRSLNYQTLESCRRFRRVVSKVEYSPQCVNVRVVTSLATDKVPPGELYTQNYCPRGEMENRFKEQQLELFSARTSTHTFEGNQLRLWFSSVAYVLMNALRSQCLANTELRHAQVGTIRTKLLKLGARVLISVRPLLILSAVVIRIKIYLLLLPGIYRLWPILVKTTTQERGCSKTLTVVTTACPTYFEPGHFFMSKFFSLDEDCFILEVTSAIYNNDLVILHLVSLPGLSAVLNLIKNWLSSGYFDDFSMACEKFGIDTLDQSAFALVPSHHQHTTRQSLPAHSEAQTSGNAPGAAGFWPQHECRSDQQHPALHSE